MKMNEMIFDVHVIFLKSQQCFSHTFVFLWREEARNYHLREMRHSDDGCSRSQPDQTSLSDRQLVMSPSCLIQVNKVTMTEYFYIITSAKEVFYLYLFIYLSFCLLARLRKKF